MKEFLDSHSHLCHCNEFKDIVIINKQVSLVIFTFLLNSIVAATCNVAEKDAGISDQVICSIKS